MKILILGGIGDALQLTRALCDSPHQPIYSLAGKGSVPELNCPVRTGGFGGADGLSNYLREQQIELLIDATHPYASTISLHAFEAAGQAGIPLWAYQRPPWPQQEGDRWIQTPDWYHTLSYSGFRRPLITIGSSVAARLDEIPDDQHWLVRALPGKLTAGSGYEVLDARGPFDFESELQLMRDKQIDVLVAKNSGGTAVAAKIRAARQLSLAIIFQSRPQLPEPERLFYDIEKLQDALKATSGNSPY